jgi:hypothetical protein
VRNTQGLIPWKPGQSGNPSGRPKEVKEATDRLDKLTLKAVEVFEKSIASKSVRQKLRVAEKIIDHRIPKVPQSVEIDLGTVTFSLPVEAVKLLGDKRS